MTLAVYEVRIDDGLPTPFSTRRCRGAAALVDVIEWMLASVGDEAERKRARTLLQRRLRHPEIVGLSGGPPTLETEATIHPKAGTRLAAYEGGPVCVCGAARSRHDIDGQRADCDGYVEAP
jgi:hypothetical protein